MTGAFVNRLGKALALQMSPGQRVVIGMDTRESGPAMLVSLAEGLSGGGVGVIDLGVVPTPAVALLVLELGAAAGAVISASHNPYTDNGIKFFDATGGKFDDGTEAAIEAALAAEADCTAEPRIERCMDAGERYLRACAAAVRFIDQRSR